MPRTTTTAVRQLGLLLPLFNLEDGERHRDAGDGHEISLDPLLAGAQAAAVVDHRGVVPGLSSEF